MKEGEEGERRRRRWERAERKDGEWGWSKNGKDRLNRAAGRKEVRLRANCKAANEQRRRGGKKK